jgi:hypothetical protein
MKATELIEAIKRALPILKEEKIPPGFLETIEMMFSTAHFELDRERLNILLSYWHLPPMEKPFFDHYFKKNVTSLTELEVATEEFIRDALWHFGDLERAYLVLSKLSSVDTFFKSHSFDLGEFQSRLPWHMVEEIQPHDRGYLGYVSGERPKQQKELLPFAEAVLEEIDDNKSDYDSLDTKETAKKVFEKLSGKFPDLQQKIEQFQSLSHEKNLDLFSSANLDVTKSALENYKQQVEQTLVKVDGLKKIGIRNQEHYLRNIESIDVYVATSMRDDHEYTDMFNFVTDTFKHEDLLSLNLRYFDPTLCYCDSRIDKGIIECLLVRSTRVTIYCAQDGDTFGKDSELAATLAQGKPVIVYVPIAKETDHQTAHIKDPTERQTKFNLRKRNLESRAKTFKEFHPLGLQVGLYDGVARGVIVVRSPEECARILRKILTNTLEVRISYEQHGIVLREKETDSIVRVMTGWGTLASCFWNQFSKTQKPKSGLPE